MKHLFYMLIFLLCSCTSEDFQDKLAKEGEDITLKFKVDIPEEQPVDTRAINENLISDLRLLVFDENGRFISRHQATLSGTNFVVTLPQSNNKRIIHFIANFNWNNFNDAASVTKDEGEIVASLQSTDLIFWQRMVLASGINTNSFTTQPISLIRNMAKFSLENRASVTLTNVTFALFNKASAGSVAPFNTVSRTFDPVITEPAGVTFTDASTFGSADIYTFERKNSTVTDSPTYVIIRGTYAGVTCYYKIDIIDANKNMYDIKRNVWFKIIIQGVTLPGYQTLETAQNSPASNNISASVLLQSYPTISDGSFVLSVDKTVVSFTSNGQTLRANASYKTVAGISLNSSITVTLVQDPNFPVVNGAVSYDVATGNLTANINNVPANGVSYFATIKLEAGNLSRTIRLMLHSPFTFTNINLTPSAVSNVLESPATLKFTIPSEASYLLPFNCYITSAYLTPSFGNIEVIHENGLYKYKWKVTAVGEQTINFKTNTNNAAETIFIDADLFQRGQITYSNTNAVNRFSNVVITPNPVNFGVTNAVQLKFTVPTAGTFKIYTSNLNPVSGTVVGGIYTYTTAVAGAQVINFTTNKQNIAETIRLTGINYLDYSIALKNQLVNLSGTLTYGTASTSSVINNGTITASVGTKVVGIFSTSATGTYQVYLEVNMGDVLTFQYTSGTGKTYSTTTTMTSALMTITKKLL
ncbi:hypothetical protein [Bacteroides sp.]|uniref:hypothetical protein n=1 Tax=Bacteroides sp. TaxID=29523 RepID=UPI00261606FF|nr:hypothetical protein [Bacteroides sp.]MDD3037377.1 hypothetical protein [Bacteroides sp.]